MASMDPEIALRSTADRVGQLCRDAPADPAHKARLRQALLQRHAELIERGRSPLWLRLLRSKRLTVIAPIACALAAICLVILSSLQVSGHRTTPAAEAARLTQALVHTVPSVTAWRVTIHQEGNNTADVLLCANSLRPEGLFVRDGVVYLYLHNQWYQVPSSQASDARCPPYWQWIFAVLPAQMAQQKVHIEAGGRIDGRETQRITYALSTTSSKTVYTTVWVDRDSGLLLRFERNIQKAGKTIGRVTGSYEYQERAA